MAKNSKYIMTKHNLKARILFWFLSISIFFGIGIYFLRHNLFKDLINPLIPFQVSPIPKAPEYSLLKNWYFLENPNSDVAIFIIHPTTYYNGKKGWNIAIDDNKSRKILNDIVIPNHIMPFSHAGDIFMPYYRQATLYSTLAFNDDTKESLNLAYKDIEIAFDAFLKQIKDKPFIIVGINQGGLHASRLIQSKIANNILEKRLISAYLIDQTIGKDEFNKTNFGNLKICSNKNETNCIITYKIIDEKNNRNQFLFKKRTPLWTKEKQYHPLSKKENICVNPLNGGEKTGSSSKENFGAVSASGLENNIRPPFLPHETGANCIDGILKVSASRSQNLKPNPFILGTFFKVNNYNLFYDAIMKDAKTRAINYKIKQ